VSEISTKYYWFTLPFVVYGIHYCGNLGKVFAVCCCCCRFVCCSHQYWLCVYKTDTHNVCSKTIELDKGGVDYCCNVEWWLGFTPRGCRSRNLTIWRHWKLPGDRFYSPGISSFHIKQRFNFVQILTLFLLKLCFRELFTSYFFILNRVIQSERAIMTWKNVIQ